VRIFQFILVCTGVLLFQPCALHAESLTLDKAMHLAAETHPEMHMAEQDVAAARGLLREQSSYAYNPELLVEPQRRRFADRTNITADYYVTLSQQIEIPGKRASRGRAAAAMLEAAKNRARDARQRRMLAAARAAVMLDFFTHGEDVRRQQREIMQRLLDAVKQGYAAGEKSMLDVNLARASYASAVSMAAQAEQSRLMAERDMANALGLAEKAGHELRVILPALDRSWEPPADAVRLALASRPDLQAVKASARAGEAKAQLAGLERIPDPTLSLLAGQDTHDRILGVGVNIPLPVLNSHTGAYKAAVAERERSRLASRWRTEQLKREVATAVRAYGVASRTLKLFVQGQTPEAEKNIRLAQTAYENGEMDLSDLVVYLDRSLNARMTRLELVKQLWLARIRVAAAIGRPDILENRKGQQP